MAQLCGTRKTKTEPKAQHMDATKYLVIGAGMSGLSFAHFIDDEVLVVEAADQIGGYCKTVEKDGFIWDYSGHFFHFKHPEIEQWLVDNMDDEVRIVSKNSLIRFADRLVDFPFQKNIHQLPQADFIDCLYELYFRNEAFPDDKAPENFLEMLFQKFGRGIAERFLIPYNEKLYACSLDELDVNAMGRFFPFADVDEIIRNFKRPDNASYNATFTYPRGGAIQYVNAIANQLPANTVSTGERVIAIDRKAKVARTNKRSIRYETLVSSAPFDRLLELCGEPTPAELLRYNRVLVFNLGFDRKGPEDVHWIYYPERKYRFYRVGFYDNIFDTERLSIYVEIGFPAEGTIDVDRERARVLEDLAHAGVIDDHQLVAEHHVVLDPAYVHITAESNAFVDERRKALATDGLYSIGRYGAWTYCAIEDNIIEARELAARLKDEASA